MVFIGLSSLISGHMSWSWRVLAILAAALPTATGIIAGDFECTLPSPVARLPATTTPLPGPPPAQRALLPYAGRRCLYLPTPDGKFTLEVCLYKSLRFIDQENFSIFLGYFARWAEGGAAVQEYSGGQSWGCAGNAQRSAALHFVCQDKVTAPAITLWQETAPCRYIAHIALAEWCA
jgi:hypothetical protein